MERFDVAVIGAGILGLATARELLGRHPELRIVVLEKERAVATHQTGHNSGVIHSGVYYKPGSEKARLCVLGRQLLIEHCRERDIPFELCGKLIVAVGPDELDGLREIERRGVANGVEGLRQVDAQGIREIEPAVRGLAGLFVPGAGIVDFALLARRLATDLETGGVQVRTGVRVIAVEPTAAAVRLRTADGAIEAERAVACAGLQSDRLVRGAGAPAEPRIVPFRGDYYLLRPSRRHLVRGLVYPVPDPRFPFLGIHFTRRIDGSVLLGPNAVLALAREGYGRADLDLGDLAETLMYRGFRTMARRYWRTGVSEVVRDIWRPAFLAELHRYMPELVRDDLTPGPSGVRAQAVDALGELLDDFAFDQVGRLLNVRNAPSPAATSAFALARVFADRVLAKA